MQYQKNMFSFIALGLGFVFLNWARLTDLLKLLASTKKPRNRKDSLASPQQKQQTLFNKNQKSQTWIQDNMRSHCEVLRVTIDQTPYFVILYLEIRSELTKLSTGVTEGSWGTAVFGISFQSSWPWRGRNAHRRT